jgi:hypothetical protein
MKNLAATGVSGESKTTVQLLVELELETERQQSIRMVEES